MQQTQCPNCRNYRVKQSTRYWDAKGARVIGKGNGRAALISLAVSVIVAALVLVILRSFEYITDSRSAIFVGGVGTLLFYLATGLLLWALLYRFLSGRRFANSPVPHFACTSCGYQWQNTQSSIDRI